MRKLTLLLSLLVLAGLTFGQEAKMRPGNGDKTLTTTKQITEPAAKETVIWSEDFNGAKWSGTVTADDFNGYSYNGTTALPEGWSVFDSNDLGYYWHWSDKGPRGRWTSGQGAAAFTPSTYYFDMLEGSKENGFFILESDFYNTTENGEMVPDENVIDMDSYVQFGPIDFSNYQYVEFNISEVFRYCCSTSSSKMSLYLSSDYDPADETSAHWREINLKNGAVGNEAMAASLKINVSPIVGNKSSVYFRIKQSAASHYMWLIDDISFTVPVENDLAVKDSWFDYLTPGLPATSTMDASFRFNGGYSKIPVQVAGDFVAFRTAVQNVGVADQTFSSRVIIKKDDAEVYNQTSPSLSLTSGQADTAKIETAFTIDGKGFYQVSGSLVMENVDANPENNNFGYDFNVTENEYSRVIESDIANYDYAGPWDWQNGGNDGDALAQYFDIPEGSGVTKLAGLRFFMPTYGGSSWTEEKTAILNGQYSVIAKVWTDGEVNTEIASSDSKIILESDLGTWVYMTFNDEGNLYLDDVTGGQSILVGLELYNGSSSEDATKLYWSIGADNSNIKQPQDGGIVYLSSKQTWYLTGDNFAVDLYLNEMPASKVNLTFNVDMNGAIEAGTFVAGTDAVYATGSFNGWIEPGKDGSILLADANNDGIYSGSAQVDQNQTVEYKYFKNAGWDGGEWSGGDNRSIEIALVNVTVNDVWANGISVNDNQLSAISVYPNPFKEQLVIENAANVSKVTISNVLGQKVMVKTNLTNNETISTTDFAKGVYFVTFTDNANNNRTMRIVKQ